MNNTIGIYKITCTVTNKFYIGSSTNLKRRISQHKNLLSSNCHHSIHLQRAYNKYGNDNFSFSILEYCTKDNLIEREQYHLNTLLFAQEYITGKSDFFIKKGYNICPFSIKGFTGKQSRLSILKQLGSKGFSKIYKVDINGTILQSYDMKSEINESVDKIYKSIKNNQTLRGKDYGFINENDYVIGYKPKLTTSWNKGLNIPTDKGTKLFVYDIYGRYFCTFLTIFQAANYFKTSSSAICKKINKTNLQLSGKTNMMYYNFFTTEQNYNNFLNFSNNKDEIEVYTVFNEFVGYTNLNDAVNQLNVTISSIRAVLSKTRKQIKGYVLKYYKDIV